MTVQTPDSRRSELAELTLATTIVLGAVVSRRGRQWIGTFPWQPSDPADLASLGALLASGELRPVAHERIDLDGVPGALRRMASGAARGKFVVVP